MVDATKAIADQRRAREGLLRTSAARHDSWLREQVYGGLVAQLDELIVTGNAAQLKHLAGVVARLSTTIATQRKWRAYSQTLGAGGPDMITTALRARKDLIQLMLDHPEHRHR